MSDGTSNPTELFSVKGMVALITGGGTGIGLMMARAIADAGAAKVYIAGRRLEVLESAAKTINKPDVVVPLTCDVTSQSSLTSLVAEVEKRSGYLNLLVCNSGIGGPQVPYPSPETSLQEFREKHLAIPMDQYDKTFSVNVTAVWYTAMAFLELLDKGNKQGNLDWQGQVLVTSSIAGYNKRAPGGWAYGQSKAAATHSAKQLAGILPKWGIRANALAPGLFPSEMSAPIVEAVGGDASKGGLIPLEKSVVPLGRMGDAQDMMGTVLYLVSRAGAYLNGNVTVLDGGRLENSEWFLVSRGCFSTESSVLHRSTKLLVAVSPSQDPWNLDDLDPTTGRGTPQLQLQQRRRMNGLLARACSIQDPVPSSVSATRGHHDATWRPGAMDADWDELSRQLLPPPGGQSVPTVVTALAFDSSQELLWAGNGYGRVTSFYANNLQKYTSFRAHPPSEGAVHQLLFNEKGVLALGARGVHMALRRGPPVWPHISAEDMRDLRCMSFTSKATSEILVAGVQDTMFVIDTNKGEIVKRIPTAHHYIKMKKGRYICAATTDGNVHILDPVKFNIIHKWRAHSAFINDMDVQQDFVVTCGTSLKQPAATYMLDPFVMVFDLKNLATMPPIPFPPLAAYVRMHPRMLTTGIVASQGGQMHVVDLLNPNTSNVRQANVVGSVLTGIEIAPSGEAIALADTDCNMHLWGSPTKCHFVELPQPTEWPDEEVPPPHIDWKEHTPLNSIGMPYYREALSSALPNTSISDVGAPPPRFAQNDLAHLTKASFGFYGPNTRGTRRNQIEDTRVAEKTTLAIRAPKFLSEKARDATKVSSSATAPDGQVDMVVGSLGTAELESLRMDVPALYQSVEISFSKYGVDDFDFGFYNMTRYAGLENHIPNSYANSLLQVLHFTPLVRNLALQHAATDCLSEMCLLCELGYLSDMLQKTEGSSCHASNLLKCLSNHPPASRLGLLEEDSRQGSLTKMMQQLTRFLLQTMADDYRTKSPIPTAMQEILATSALTTIKCLNCGNETSRSGSNYVTDLTYPMTKGRGSRSTKTTFSQVLKTSVEGEGAMKGWCIRCNRYQSLQARKTIQGIPSVLTLNVPVAEHRDNELEQRMLWANPGWLPEEIGIIVDNGSFFCYQGEDLKLHLQRGVHNIQVYSLIGLSVNIESGSPQKSHLGALSPGSVDTGSNHKPHLVAMVNVAHAEPSPPGDSQWHLFNDFSVKPVSAAEALTFNARWKMPSVLVYQLKTANNNLDTDWVKNIDTSVLHVDFKPDAMEHPYRTLDPITERPGPETTVALDTEFVLAKQSEVEMKSDGVREVIRPNFHALARVSIVRGEGEDEGLAFIDDWIQVREPVIDYLHSYSGIKPDDLDPRNSKHCLVSLKVAYKRLWVLLNLGCKFVGHGLKGDFRVINIQVPKAQIIDTIDLFYQKNYRRKLSLKFLAWYLLKEGIQVDTHDSIEDARIALKLYKKFQEFDDAGITKMMLNEIYRAGDSVGWKPPGSNTASEQQAIVQRSPTPMTEAPSTPVRKGLAGPGAQGALTPSWSAGPGAGGFTPGRGSPLK